MKRYLAITFLLVSALGCFGGYVNTELLYRNDFRSAAEVQEWSIDAAEHFRAGAGSKGSGALYFQTRGTAWGGKVIVGTCRLIFSSSANAFPANSSGQPGASCRNRKNPECPRGK